MLCFLKEGSLISTEEEAPKVELTKAAPILTLELPKVEVAKPAVTLTTSEGITLEGFEPV